MLGESQGSSGGSGGQSECKWDEGGRTERRPPSWLLVLGLRGVGEDSISLSRSETQIGELNAIATTHGAKQLRVWKTRDVCDRWGPEIQPLRLRLRVVHSSSFKTWKFNISIIRLPTINKIWQRRMATYKIVFQFRLRRRNLTIARLRKRQIARWKSEYNNT